MEFTTDHIVGPLLNFECVLNVKTVVETYSGYKADEYPVRFQYDNLWLEIIDIEDRWYGPDYSYFRVFTDTCQRYILKQDIQNNTWNVTAVEANTD